jgi:hypothetical protein
MISVKRTALALLLIVALTFSALAGTVYHGTVQAATSVNGLMTSDTTWTKAGSPYSLTGPVAINQGVTLRVEPGVTVNLNGYYIRINGTLNARGSPTDKITFNGGELTFTTVSNGWNEPTQSGCIIQNAVINQIVISNKNPIKIDSSIINSNISVTSSSVISNSIVTGDISSLMSTISNNNVKGDITLGSVSVGGFTTAEESSIVSGNTVEGTISSGSPKGTPKIFDNTVSEGGIACTGYGSIHNNYVHNCVVGIGLYSTRVFGGYLGCYATVENNVVVDNDRGIRIALIALDGPGSQTPTAQYNTIARNSIGISLYESNYGATPTIRYNNLENNIDYNFYLSASNSPDVSYNWWGTMDESAINQSIYDFKNDFNSGTVNFVPFLTAPNPDAPAIPTPTSTPTPPPTSSPSPTLSPNPTTTPSQEPALTPEQSEAIIGAAIVIVVIGAGLGLLIYLIKRK